MIRSRTFCESRTILLALALLLVSGAASRLSADAIAMSDCLPPADPNDAYVGQFHHYAAGGHTYDLTNPIHAAFTMCSSPPLTGTVLDTFDSTVSGNLFVDGTFLTNFTGDAHTMVNVTFHGSSGPTRVFDTEMIQLDISGPSGPSGPLIRESPTLHSLGQTTITDLGSGQFRIDSFFDVFTELSLDGGNNWIPSSGPDQGGTVMTLETMPEPASLFLLGTGLIAGAYRWRKHQNA